MRSISVAGWFAAFVVLAAAGCSQTYVVKLTPVTNYPAGQKINLRTDLRMTPEFTQYVAAHEFNTGQTNMLPIGTALSDNAERVARAVFTPVTINAVGATAGMQAVLTPRVVNFEGTMVRPLGFGDTIYQVINVEWTMTDPQGKMIWVGTVQGKGEAPLPVTSFEVMDMHTKQMQMLMNDLFRNTYESLSTAPEIRKYAAARNPG